MTDNGIAPYGVLDPADQHGRHVPGPCVRGAVRFTPVGYSVHTSPAALRLGEGNIESLRLALATSGDRRTANGVVPVFRATPAG